MAERTSYTPGTFSWADLTTTDQEAAKAFYMALFGWEVEDNPVGDGIYYSMMKLGGKEVAAISPQPQQQREAGVPPLWNSYITVASADGSLAQAKQLGATVHADAFDVMDVGRMGVVQDPQGAYFLVWQPKSRIGASLVNAPGAMSWNELASPDVEASSRFYSELFGWTLEPIAGLEMDYSVIRTAAGNTNGGIRGLMAQEPPNWLVYLGAQDVEQTAAKAQELGGAKVAGPFPAGPGTAAVVRDPQGGVFALYAGEFDE
jgi:uncharacterized protein